MSRLEPRPTTTPVAQRLLPHNDSCHTTTLVAQRLLPRDDSCRTGAASVSKTRSGKKPQVSRFVFGRPAAALREDLSYSHLLPVDFVSDRGFKAPRERRLMSRLKAATYNDPCRTTILAARGRRRSQKTGLRKSLRSPALFSGGLLPPCGKTRATSICVEILRAGNRIPRRPLVRASTRRSGRLKSYLTTILHHGSVHRAHNAVLAGAGRMGSAGHTLVYKNIGF